MANIGPLISHVRQFVPLSSTEEAQLATFFEDRTLKKKELLLEADQPCTHTYFVKRGILHMYFLTEKGAEQTVQVAIENWWLTDQLAYRRQSPSPFFIRAVEKSEVLALTHAQQTEMFAAVPAIESYFRHIFEIAYGASLHRQKHFLGLSKEEIYHQFNDQFPEFVQRVPQYLVASLLGFTPEYLSEIRSKRRS